MILLIGQECVEHRSIEVYYESSKIELLIRVYDKYGGELIYSELISLAKNYKISNLKLPESLNNKVIQFFEKLNNMKAFW